MLIGYARVSKSDKSQSLDSQIDALMKNGVNEENVYHDYASGKNDKRPGLEACLKALRKDDVLVVWKLDRLGRSIRHLINTVQNINDKGIGFKVIAGAGADIDTSKPAGKLVFGFFAALAEFERELISERTKAGLESARARGKKGGRKYSLTKAQVRMAEAAMGKKETTVSDLCKELSVSRQTLYRYVDPEGNLRDAGKTVLTKK